MAEASTGLARDGATNGAAMAPEPTTHTFSWTWQGKPLPVGYDVCGPARGAPPILLLPAMSTVSARAEMADLARRLAPYAPTVAVDWPGFGDNPRPALDYTPDLQRGFLGAFVEHLRALRRRGSGRGRRRARRRLRPRP